MPVPPHDGRHHHRHGLILLVAVLLAGCTAPEAGEAATLTALESASVEGSIAVGDAFLLVDARLSVAPADQAAVGTTARPVPLADPPAAARTAMLRDHWVLEATLREREPGGGVGLHRVRLDWNGELAGTVYVQGAGSGGPLGVVVRFDVGPRIEASNVYAFELTMMP